MWIVLAAVSVLAAALVITVRLALVRRRTPHPDDRDRQHVVPGADHHGPPLPDQRAES